MCENGYVAHLASCFTLFIIACIYSHLFYINSIIIVICYSMMAAKCGAREVYACDESETMDR